MKSDIEIAHEAKLSPISEIAAKLGIDDFEAYGNYKAKIAPRRSDEKGKLILVTAINPTALGEGKTTTSIGLADGMAKLGKRCALLCANRLWAPFSG